MGSSDGEQAVMGAGTRTESPGRWLYCRTSEAVVCQGRVWYSQVSH